MLNDIEMCISLNVDGLVFGILNDENRIDYEKNKKLMDHIKFLIQEKKQKNSENPIKNFDVTFHMAFDFIPYHFQFDTIDSLAALGFTRILTKGCISKALDGIENIKKYVSHANGKIIIMPGGGVTKENYMKFVKECNCIEVHGTKIV